MTARSKPRARRAPKLGHVRRDGRAKRGYETREAAERRLPRNQYPYRCGLCGLWHRATSPGA